MPFGHLFYLFVKHNVYECSYWAPLDFLLRHHTYERGNVSHTVSQNEKNIVKDKTND